MPITDVIKARRSVRTYEKKPIAKEIWDSIEKEVAELSMRYSVKLQLLKNDFRGKNFGTYGMIKDADGFIGIVCLSEKEAMMQAGMILEDLVLFCTERGIGTCWLGGSFRRDEFYSAIKAEKEEFIPAIISIGYPKEKERLMNSLVRRGAKSDSRLPFGQLFFDGDLEHPMQETGTPEGKAFAAVQQGPSASNKQPWRVIKNQDTYHFYLAHTPGYGKGLPFDMQLLDMGIAMCHFERVLEELGQPGDWEIADPELLGLPENMEYMSSFILHSKECNR